MTLVDLIVLLCNVMEKHTSEMYLRNESQISTTTTAESNGRNVPTFCLRTIWKFVYGLLLGLVVLLVLFAILLFLYLNLSNQLKLQGEMIEKLNQAQPARSSAYKNDEPTATMRTVSNFKASWTGARPSLSNDDRTLSRINKTRTGDSTKPSDSILPSNKVSFSFISVVLFARQCASKLVNQKPDLLTCFIFCQ